MSTAINITDAQHLEKCKEDALSALKEDPETTKDEVLHDFVMALAEEGKGTFGIAEMALLLMSGVQSDVENIISFIKGFEWDDDYIIE